MVLARAALAIASTTSGCCIALSCQAGPPPLRAAYREERGGSRDRRHRSGLGRSAMRGPSGSRRPRCRRARSGGSGGRAAAHRRGRRLPARPRLPGAESGVSRGQTLGRRRRAADAALSRGCAGATREQGRRAPASASPPDRAAGRPAQRAGLAEGCRRPRSLDHTRAAAAEVGDRRRGPHAARRVGPRRAPRRTPHRGARALPRGRAGR